MTPPNPGKKSVTEFGSVVLPKGVKLKIESPESPAEIRSRLQEQKAEAIHARSKDLLLFRVVLAGVVAVAGLCLWVALGPGHTPDDKKWSTSILTSMVSAGVGYLTGKAVK